MKRYRLFDVLYTAILLATVWVTFICRAPYRLEFKEQISIFLFDADRISWYLSNPAVVASIAGDWLTQFYVNGKVGAVLSALLLALTVLGLERFLKLSEPKRPSCMLLLAMPVMLEGYFIPFPNYPVSATLGLAFAVWMGFLLACIKNHKYSSVVYGRPYIAYIGPDGTIGKPFLLPQKDPDKYTTTLKSFNLPELYAIPEVYNARDAAAFYRKVETEQVQYKP